MLHKCMHSASSAFSIKNRKTPPALEMHHVRFQQPNQLGGCHKPRTRRGWETLDHVSMRGRYRKRRRRTAGNATGGNRTIFVTKSRFVRMIPWLGRSISCGSRNSRAAVAFEFHIQHLVSCGNFAEDTHRKGVVTPASKWQPIGRI
jgi:hypothetical protein